MREVSTTGSLPAELRARSPATTGPIEATISVIASREGESDGAPVRRGGPGATARRGGDAAPRRRVARRATRGRGIGQADLLTARPVDIPCRAAMRAAAARRCRAHDGLHPLPPAILPRTANAAAETDARPICGRAAAQPLAEGRVAVRCCGGRLAVPCSCAVRKRGAWLAAMAPRPAGGRCALAGCGHGGRAGAARNVRPPKGHRAPRRGGGAAWTTQPRGARPAPAGAVRGRAPLETRPRPRLRCDEAEAATRSAAGQQALFELPDGEEEDEEDEEDAPRGTATPTTARALTMKACSSS